MSRKVLLRRHARMEPGFNLTPMLDMVFYLLFFFILSTKMRDEAAQLDIRLPASRTAPAESKPEPPPALTLSADGQVHYKGRTMIKEELDLELHYLLAKGQQVIVLKGDERADYGRVIEVMDWCKLAGMKTVMLDLRRELAPGPAAGE